MRAALALLLALAAITTTTQARTWYITPDGSGDAPGIQAGIDSATSGDTVLVACGTHYEHDIVMKSGITLRSETGDPACATIDAQELSRILYCGQVDSTSFIEGFTITRGRSGDGGGIYVISSALRISDCLVRECRASGNGGGMYCRYSWNARVDSLVFASNRAGLRGGGVYAVRTSTDFRKCLFSENRAIYEGGGVACFDSGEPRFEDCVFVQNYAYDGAGLYSGMSGGPSTFIGGCVFLRNVADWIGGGVYCLNGSMTITRCTFHGNGADNGGGVFSNYSNPVIEKTIIAFSTEGRAVHYGNLPSAPSIECCDFYGNEGYDWVGGLEDLCGQDGNFSEDPLFCDADNGDLSLDANSPCVDAAGCGRIGAFGPGCGISTIVTGGGGVVRPAEFLSVFPNPFCDEVGVRIASSRPGRIAVAVYDIGGRLVTELFTDGSDGRVMWDGRDGAGRRAAPGVYFFRVVGDGLLETRRACLVR